MNKDAIRLTTTQKIVILAMREKEHVFGWSSYLSKFSFHGKTFRYNLGCGLQNSGLIERNPLSKSYIEYSYTLTTLGRTIKL